MTRTTATLMIALALALTGCGDDQPTELEDIEFSVTVRAVDAAGDPVPGLNVGLANDVFVDADKDAPTAAVVIPFVIPESSLVRLFVNDVEGERAATLIDEQLPVGVHHYLWDGLDDDEEALPAGRYTLKLLAFPPGGSTPVFTAEADVFMQRDPGDLALGVTDSDGEFTVTDTRLLPFFYALGDMIATDETGERVGLIEVMTTATVSVWDDQGGLSADAYAFEFGPNDAEIVFDPEPAAPAAKSVRSVGLASSGAALADEAVFEMGDPYPNPFN